MAFIIVVLPVPGPPVIIETLDVTDLSTASRCNDNKLNPSFSSQMAIHLSASSLDGKSSLKFFI